MFRGVALVVKIWGQFCHHAGRAILQRVALPIQVKYPSPPPLIFMVAMPLHSNLALNLCHLSTPHSVINIMSLLLFAELVLLYVIVVKLIIFFIHSCFSFIYFLLPPDHTSVYFIFFFLFLISQLFLIAVTHHPWLHCRSCWHKRTCKDMK